jgi:hypothetical protein
MGNRIYWLAYQDGEPDLLARLPGWGTGSIGSPTRMGKFRKREKGIRKSFGYYFQFSVPSLIIIDDR